VLLTVAIHSVASENYRLRYKDTRNAEKAGGDFKATQIGNPIHVAFSMVRF